LEATIKPFKMAQAVTQVHHRWYAQNIRRFQSLSSGLSMVQPRDEKRVLVPNELPWHGVLNLIKKGKAFVVEKNSANIKELL
jgi:hypothetical protein